MTTTANTSEQALRSALESADYGSALTALQEYWDWFTSEQRSSEQIAAAMGVIGSSLQAALAGKARLSAQYRFLTAGSAAAPDAATPHEYDCRV